MFLSRHQISSQQQFYSSGHQSSMMRTNINHGKSHVEYKAIGMDKALELTSDTGIYSYCGLKVKKHFYLEKADKANEEVIAKWKKDILSVYSI